MALGLGFWSFAAVLAGLSRNIAALVAFRSMVGVGIGTFSVIAGPVLCD
eukprot:CAMPEP_0170307098 /NCGR_PEP_ID=MMETSP0116_2-20130129/53956_1 /TAXON_ID=400756 /ORGANISM="Durinskia baltica, Strain CSIRO CS-38" /LENGTH=48 /DNA_ID= /DNA_START= /DNA_END= /DNA_ORIENTATION=